MSPISSCQARANQLTIKHLLVDIHDLSMFNWLHLIQNPANSSYGWSLWCLKWYVLYGNSFNVCKKSLSVLKYDPCSFLSISIERENSVSADESVYTEMIRLFTSANISHFIYKNIQRHKPIYTQRIAGLKWPLISGPHQVRTTQRATSLPNGPNLW